MENRDEKSTRRPRRRRRRHPLPVILALAAVLAVLALRAGDTGLLEAARRVRVEDLAALEVPEYVDVQIIDVDGDSRRGTRLEGIESIVIHYVGNPGTTAQQNRDWYANPQSTVSSHFLVGLEGEVIQCIPLDEKSSASNHRNADTISIEVCHPDDTGKFNDAAYGSLVELTAWLVRSCGLEPEDVIRHYDVTGKECPRYFVRNEAAWTQFLADVEERYHENET